VPARVEQVGAGSSLVGEGVANTCAAVAAAWQVARTRDYRTLSEYSFESGQETMCVGAEGGRPVENTNVAVHLAEHPFAEGFAMVPVTVAAKSELHIEMSAADVEEGGYVLTAKLAEKRPTYH